MAEGLRSAGVEGFLAAYDFSNIPEQWRKTVETVVRQRLSLHEHPEAVANALEVVPRSRPFAEMDELAAIAVPTIVVGSRDEVDPGHPLALAEAYAQAIAGAQLSVEEGGSPLRSPSRGKEDSCQSSLRALFKGEFHRWGIGPSTHSRGHT